MSREERRKYKEEKKAKREQERVRQKELEKILADADIFKDKNRSVPLLREYDVVKAELDELFAEWERSQGRLEATREKLGL